MSIFNKKSAGAYNEINKTENFAGGEAFKMSPELELFTTAVTTLSTSDKFYESFDDRLSRLRELIKVISEKNPEFVAKLAVYCRENANLRSIPVILLVELAKLYKGTDLVSRATLRTIQRADEITEFLAVYQYANGRHGERFSKKLNKISNQLKKGIREAFHKFDEYQFSKYNKKNEIRLRDALFLTHPKPLNDEEARLFHSIANDSLATAETWETSLSAEGQKGKEANKKEVWEDLITNNKLGYMAVLRNLKNILNADVNIECIRKICGYISNENAVKNSKQLPFRFLTAYREICNINSTNSNAIVKALEAAAIHSAKNLPFNDSDRILIASDVSGSMYSTISEKSSVMQYDIGLLSAMTFKHKCSFVDSGFFGDFFKLVNLPSDNILYNVSELKRREGEVGYSTNGYEVIKFAIKNKKAYDKILIFTDSQLWDSNFYGNYSIQNEWNNYKKMCPNCKLYLFDLAGYGTSPIRLIDKDVFLIAGFSDRMYSIFENLENGGKILDEINQIVL